jgi:hypothetical protein
MWIQGKELSAIEASLMRHLPTDDAAGAIRSVSERTRDLLPVAVRVVEILSDGNSQAMAARVDRLMIQLELGVPAAMVPLAKYATARLGRGDYLALHTAGLSSVDALATSKDSDLQAIVGDQKKVRVIRESEARIHERVSRSCRATSAHRHLRKRGGLRQFAGFDATQMWGAVPSPGGSRFDDR